jgi:(p)ppGpp synthase/HD superfamily hydrolase
MENSYTVFAEALNIAGAAHRTQARKGKLDGRKVSYMTHPTKVMYAVSLWSQSNYRLSAAALLHDVLEDVPKDEQEYYREKIRDLGKDILVTVETLTKDKKDSYEEYIKKIVASENLWAIVIKVSDICANVNDSDMFFGELSDKIKKKIKIIVENFMPILEKSDENTLPMQIYAARALSGMKKRIETEEEVKG